jgi:hypothetical protein
VYIYASKRDFFGALPPFSAEWTGGRMFPEYGVIMINFGQDNLEWGLRATSHELSHAILHAKIPGILGELSVPHWLDEGLAVYNESDDHSPDPQFDEAFQIPLRRNALIPLRRLQDRFPNDSDQALLAYGQSYSAVRFMIDAYGKERFSQLLGVYQRGAAADTALVEVYQLNQDQLENEWRQSIGAPLREFSTAALPTLLPRPTYEFSSPATPLAPTPTKTAATPAPTRVSVADSPAVVADLPDSNPNVPASSLCGGLVAIIGLVAIATRRSRP